MTINGLLHTLSRPWTKMQPRKMLLALRSQLDSREYSSVMRGVLVAVAPHQFEAAIYSRGSPEFHGRDPATS